MDKTQKIIIICLIGLIIALTGGVAFSLMQEPIMTIELFDKGTTVEVPESTIFKNQDECSITYLTSKNTTIMGIDKSNPAGELVSKALSNLTKNGEKQENGLYKLDKKNMMKMADKLGKSYDKNNLKDVYICVKNNNTINQTVIVIGIDEQEMTTILDSIHWKRGNVITAASKTSSEVSSSSNTGNSQSSSDNKTVPEYYLFFVNEDTQNNVNDNYYYYYDNSYSDDYENGYDDVYEDDYEDYDDSYDDEYYYEEDY
ncbi:MAG: hypothetical protein ACI389_05390 [Methanobrevibacter sp.]|uniref:hypothetical protein n=1 Tax=Methanobrevibacter sp. TaxID=66852 RepID=UPI003F0C300B